MIPGNHHYSSRHVVNGLRPSFLDRLECRRLGACCQDLGRRFPQPVDDANDMIESFAWTEDHLGVTGSKASVVVEFGEDTALEAVKAVRPDIYVKGGDYDMASIPEGQAVLAYGGQAVAIDFEHDRSTSKLLAKVRSQE